MTSIYKTAYPYYSDKKKISKELVTQNYRLTFEELELIKSKMGNHLESRLNLAVLMVVFKNLNYFPEITIIPKVIIDYVKEQLRLQNTEFGIISKSSISRHKKTIYQFYKITPWNKISKNRSGTKNYLARNFAEESATKASQKHNYPADIINSVIEDLKKSDFELPTFKQLDKIVISSRAKVNETIFKKVFKSLSEKQKSSLDELLSISSDYKRSHYNDLKSLPKNPTISNFRDLLKYHDWLFSFGEVKNILSHIIPLKLKQFSEQAKSLDASDLKDFNIAKRYTLILSLILKAQMKTKDALATTFCKTIIKMHKRAKDQLEKDREFYLNRTRDLLSIFSDILETINSTENSKDLVESINQKVEKFGGARTLINDCDKAIGLNSQNYLPFISDYYNSNKRNVLLNILEVLDIKTTTQENALVNAVKTVIGNRSCKNEYILGDVDLTFTTKQWQRLIIKRRQKIINYHRQYLEICVLSHVANELRSKDLFIMGADSFADYREDLIPLDKCKEMMADYCKNLEIPLNSCEAINNLKIKLTNKAKKVDSIYPDVTELVIDDDGAPSLKKREPKRKPSSALWLEKILKQRMQKRNLIDVFCSSHFYCGWADVFGPISGSESKLKSKIESYLLTNFSYATGLGPTQTALHVRGEVSAHTISWVNRRHVTPEMLDNARVKLINLIKQFKLTETWGDGKSVAGDGTMEELREQSLIAEFHFRYRKKGGIAYHHVANNYILLFSTFMSCGVWEAVEIIEGLLKNESDVQPDIIHGDTQAQSTVVFALAYLLGFRLMPRIRNWGDLKLFKPTKATKYKHIESLFKDVIDWALIEKHWVDIMQVVLSIKEGKMSSSKLLRKLSNHSRKNRLFQAFQELGYVIRTIFLLDYISDVKLRETITAQTNKVEAYNALSDWCSFGSEVLVASNDENEMEKAVKYNDLLANSVILQNVSDMTNIIAELIEEGHNITKNDMSYLCPYWTEHLKRFGEIVMDFKSIPKNVDRSRSKILWR